MYLSCWLSSNHVLRKTMNSNTNRFITIEWFFYSRNLFYYYFTDFNDENIFCTIFTRKKQTHLIYLLVEWTRLHSCVPLIIHSREETLGSSSTRCSSINTNIWLMRVWKSKFHATIVKKTYLKSISVNSILLDLKVFIFLKSYHIDFSVFRFPVRHHHFFDLFVSMYSN